jgi:hypothetical protein
MGGVRSPIDGDDGGEGEGEEKSEFKSRAEPDKDF